MALRAFRSFAVTPRETQIGEKRPQRAPDPTRSGTTKAFRSRASRRHQYISFVPFEQPAFPWVRPQPLAPQRRARLRDSE